MPRAKPSARGTPPYSGRLLTLRRTCSWVSGHFENREWTWGLQGGHQCHCKGTLRRTTPIQGWPDPGHPHRKLAASDRLHESLLVHENVLTEFPPCSATSVRGTVNASAIPSLAQSRKPAEIRVPLSMELPRFGGRLTTWDHTAGWAGKVESRRGSISPWIPRKRGAPASGSPELFAA